MGKVGKLMLFFSRPTVSKVCKVSKVAEVGQSKRNMACGRSQSTDSALAPMACGRILAKAIPNKCCLSE